MPKRIDIHKILIIGSGPIVIGQACEFDYSGTQACKVLREEGFEVILVNSNPATIMTDPEIAHKTYIEPITPAFIEKIIARERPDAILPTLGGQTGLNVSVKLAEKGILDKYGVEMLGAKVASIKKAEDRGLFKEAMERIGLDVPQSGHAYNLQDAIKIGNSIGTPLIIRPAFTLGGTGGGIAYNMEEFVEIVSKGIDASPIGQVLIEKSLIGWKEYELEVMRDVADNVVIICSIENFDPMGIHTGDSITVAPAQTLSDKEYQLMRDAAIKIIREIGVETGGSNVQFAINPENGSMVVIEINPRVSRSSALASKATGFPIAKIAAKLAVGYTLDEIPNDITKKTPSSFEPTIDYVVVKIPRFTFEKFKEADTTLHTSMKSVGEVMAIGRTFKEALQKAIRSLEIGRFGLGADGKDKIEPDKLRQKLIIPTDERVFYIKYALQIGMMELDEIYELTKIDKWFLFNIFEIIQMEEEIKKVGTLAKISYSLLLEAKRFGFSDFQIAFLLNVDEGSVRAFRKGMGIIPTYKAVDTCAGEFEAYTPYYYSTYEDEDEVKETDKKKVVILGSGPNRIGQGIEFDYCCVHCSFALREEGYERIMINCNPETVSTDYDVSDRLYFEPLTCEDVLNIIEREKPIGVIVQFGGQTPLNLAVDLQRAGVKILGTNPDAIDRAEDRERFKELIKKLNLIQPENGTATSYEEAEKVAKEIGYPVLIRPSYVLGGRAMEIVYDETDLERFVKEAVKVSQKHPILIDKFLEDAIEVDVDAICDGRHVVIGGIMEHVEEAGIHSGDSACALPPYSLMPALIDSIKENTYALAYELKVVGLMNVQYAIKDNHVHVLEVNPRASRTIPFVSKATGSPLAKIATKVMLGKTLEDLNFTREISTSYVAVKEVVFPFVRFSGVDVILGPEMKSTGEVMGIDSNFSLAFAKSQIAADQELPLNGGQCFITVNDRDKEGIVPIAHKLVALNFSILATKGTSAVLQRNGIEVTIVSKLREERPHVVDLMKDGQISLIINTPGDKATKEDERIIRTEAILRNIPLITTISGARASVNGIEALINKKFDVKSLQEYHNYSEISTT